MPCWSWIGKMAKKWEDNDGYTYYQPQNLLLGEGCWSVGIIMHEFMHAMGKSL